MGEKDNGKRSNWSIEMIEANAQRDRGNDATGLILSFDILVDGGTTFENGMPTGKFDIYETILDPNYGFEVDGEDNRGLSNGSYTFFYIVFQGDTGTKRAWTGGSVTVEKDENGVYSVNVDMESVYTSISTGDYYRYTLKGDYKGEVKLDDFLNPQMVQARKASAASKLNKTGYSFSKTGVTE